MSKEVFSVVLDNLELLPDEGTFSFVGPTLNLWEDVYKRQARSGVVQEVDMRRINSKPMIDMGLALQGSVPGLMVTNTGELGSAPEIRIRGNSSLRRGNTTNEPLYVMDGKVISSETFYNLNPQDIKEIKVLKDAAACALYGIKAANGVLEITSQRGISGQTMATYTLDMGITTRGRRGISMMN